MGKPWNTPLAIIAETGGQRDLSTRLPVWVALPIIAFVSGALWLAVWLGVRWLIG